MPNGISREQQAVIQLLLKTAHFELSLNEQLKQVLDIICHQAGLNWVEMASFYLREADLLERVASFALPLELDARSRQLSLADTVGWQASQGQALVWLAAPDQSQTHYDAPGYEICLVPLTTESSCLGLLMLYCQPTVPASERYGISLLELMGGILSTLIFQKLSEQRLARQHRLLQSMSRLDRCFMLKGQDSSLFDEMLIELLELTQSRYGLIAQVPFKQPKVKQTQELIQSDFELRLVACSQNSQPRPHEQKFELRWGSEQAASPLITKLKSGQAVIANQPLADTSIWGFPSGHPPISTFLGIPFYSGSSLLGIAYLANRPGGYSFDLIQELEPFIQNCLSLFELSGRDSEQDPLMPEPV